MRRPLRGLSTAAHVAVSLGTYSGSLYEIVTTDCEEKLAILGQEVDPLIGSNNQTYSIGRCTLSLQSKSPEMSTKQYSSPQSVLGYQGAPFGRYVREHCP